MRGSNKLLSEEFKKAALNDSKVGLLATVSPEGYPHVSLITTLTASKPNELSWGQFSRGLSKEYVKTNKKTSFLILTTDKEGGSGRANYHEELHSGSLYEFFNNKPMFRYNSYFGLGAIHTEDVIDVSEKGKLSIPKIIYGVLKSLRMKSFIKNRDNINRMPQYVIDLAKPLTTMKFLSYIDDEGYPIVVPALQSHVIDPDHVGVSNVAYKEIINEIPDGAKAAILIATFDLACVLVQGTGHKNKLGGIVEVEKVYNPMLPVPKYIYPIQPIPNVYAIKKH